MAANGGNKTIIKQRLFKYYTNIFLEKMFILAHQRLYV